MNLRFWDRTSNMRDRTSNFYKARRGLRFWGHSEIPCKKFKKNRFFSKFCKKKFFFKIFLISFPFSVLKNGSLYYPKCSESSPNIRTELRTPPNITFLPKTELRTSRTSQKTEQFANTGQFVPPLVYTLEKWWIEKQQTILELWSNVSIMDVTKLNVFWKKNWMEQLWKGQRSENFFFKNRWF